MNPEVEPPPDRNLALLYALNAAGASLQRSARSEAEVFAAFREQIMDLGLRGAIMMLDDTRKHLVVQAAAYTGHILDALEQLTGLQVTGFAFRPERIDAFLQVIESKQAVFLPDTREIILQLLPDAARPFAQQIVSLVGNLPAIITPIIYNGEMQGLFSVVDRGLTADQIPVLTAFASHLAAALENARLFESLQREIAARKEVERSLRESEAKYRVLVENIPAMTYIAALDNVYVTLYISPQVEQILGIPPDEYCDSDVWLHQIHPDDRERVLAEMTKCRDNGRPFRSEYRMLTRDGRTIWIRDEGALVKDESGQPLFLQGVMFDITEQKQTEEKLRQLSQFWENVIENANVWINVIDPDGNIVLWNRAAEAISGYARQEVMGHAKIWEWLYPDEAYRWQVFGEALNDIAAGRSVEHFETTIRCKDGRSRVISWNSRALKGEDGETAGAIAIGLDVTTQREAENALRLSLERLSEAQQLARLSHWEWDLQEQRVYRSDVIYDIFGITSREFSPTYEAYMNFVHPEDRERLQQAVDESLRTGRPLDITIRIVRPDGEERIIHERGEVVLNNDGKPVRMIGVDQDITEWQQLRKQVSEAEATQRLLSTAIEQADEMVMVTDTEGVILYVNPAVERITGYSREELLGRKPDILKSEGQDTTVFQEMHATISAGQGWRGRFTGLRKKDGSLFTADFTISPVRDNEGNIVNFVDVGRDVTRELEMEQRYLQAQKMEAIGRLTAGIAHDFNNLLTC